MRHPLMVPWFAVVIATAASSHAQIMTGTLGTRGQPRDIPTMTLQTDVYSDTPRFRADVTRVEVSVRVTDAQGRPVRGLTAADFTLAEDGKAQTITSFEPYAFVPDPSAVPVVKGGAAALNNHGTSSARLFAILFDDLHIDAHNTERARQVAREIIARLDPEDLLLLSVASSQETTAGFSRDRTRALELIDKAFGMRLPDPMLEQLKTASQDNRRYGLPVPGLKASQQQRAMHLTQTYRAIKRVAASVMHLRGRHKTMFLISEGSPVGATVNITDSAGEGGAEGEWREAVAAATVADLAINPIRPTGLATPGEGLIEVRGRVVDEDGQATAHMDMVNVLAQERQALEQLRDAAEMTGGMSLIDHNDVGPAVTRVIDGAADRYVLSYEPTTPVKDGRWRKIAVTIARPGVRVETRRGYMAPGMLTRDRVKPPAGLSAPLQRLLGDVVPADDLGLRAQVVPLTMRKDKVLAAVIVEVDGQTLAEGAADGEVQLEQALFTLDARGKTANATRKQLAFRVDEPRRAVLGASALRAVWAIEVTPGAHQVRLATVDQKSGRGGALYLDVTLPADSAPRGLTLASRALAVVPVAFVDKGVEPLLPVVPTVTPIFPSDDTLQVTVSGVGAGEELRVLGPADQVMWKAPLAGDADGLARVDVPLRTLTPGTFRVMAAGAADRTRTQAFTVLPR